MSERIAVYPASFDPITNGHMNVIERFAPLYDEFVVLVAVDKRKNYMFSMEERVEMAKVATSHISNVAVSYCANGYLVSKADSLGAQVLIRGLRNFKDLEDEQTLAEENRKICPNIETIFVPCLPNLMHVSSSMVKGHIGIDPCWDEQVSRSVPKVVLEKLKEKYVFDRAKKHWQSLMSEFGNPKEAESVFKEIVARYGESLRGYHVLNHIVEMLDELEEVVHLLQDKNAVKMAVWGHDYIYDTSSQDFAVIATNEERSAYEFGRQMERLGLSDEFIKKVKSHIISTSHKSPVTDSDAQFLVDLDLVIFGKPEKEFNNWEIGIRKEYFWFSEADYSKGRSDVLRSFLDRKPIYVTKFFHDKYENLARENLRGLICSLEI